MFTEMSPRPALYNPEKDNQPPKDPCVFIGLWSSAGGMLAAVILTPDGNIKQLSRFQVRLDTKWVEFPKKDGV